MTETIMVKYGEIILKGLNRPAFEEKLIKNIRRKLNGLGEIKIIKYQATIYIEPKDPDYDYDEAIERLKNVFGIIWISRTEKINKDIEVIKEKALFCLREVAEKGKSFKVEVKRPDKRFPLKSPEIQQIVGEYLYIAFENILTVDVKSPDIVVMIEIRDEGAYVYAKKEQGPGGLPLGINGKCALLLSGGIDSPVAGYMIAKRGVELIAVHFHSYPYTSDRAKKKVIDLAKKLTKYVDKIDLFIVPFTDIQLMINEKSPHDLMVILMRRYMMKIAQEIALSNGAIALVTGESLGQVASQTIQSISVTNSSVEIPVLRPLIGLDKDEITRISRKIDTFETSILPYEDCCTVFVPKHPKTKPKLEPVIKAEEELTGMDELIKEAIKNTERLTIKQGE